MSLRDRLMNIAGRQHVETDDDKPLADAPAKRLVKHRLVARKKPRRGGRRRSMPMNWWDTDLSDAEAAVRDLEWTWPQTQHDIAISGMSPNPRVQWRLPSIPPIKSRTGSARRLPDSPDFGRKEASDN